MAIVIQGAFVKATTTIDGGWSVTFSTHQGEEVTEVAKLREEPLFVCVMTEAEYFAQQDNTKVKR